MPRIADEQQFQAWEKLVDEGVPRYDASRQAGTTLSALKRADEVRFDQGVALSLERQAARVEQVVERQMQREDPPPQLVVAELRAHHPDYADKTQIEVTGKVEHEHRGEFRLGHLIAVARELGVVSDLELLAGHGDRPEEALPAPVEIPARSAGAS